MLPFALSGRAAQDWDGDCQDGNLGEALISWKTKLKIHQTDASSFNNCVSVSVFPEINTGANAPLPCSA